MAEPNFKTNVGECGCGCGEFGALKKPWRSNGVSCVKAKCRCRQCLGGGSKRKGQRKQSKATTALGIPRSSISPGHEEFLAGTVRVEVKAGKSQAGPVWTKYLLSEAQSEAARPFGDNRPFVALFMPDGSSDGLVVFRLSKLDETVVAIAEQRGLVA